jgi:hypothetical protein
MANAIQLERSSTDDDIKNAYDRGISIQSIAVKTERSEEYVQGLVYVNGDDPDGTSLEDEILETGASRVSAGSKPQK